MNQLEEMGMKREMEIFLARVDRLRGRQPVTAFASDCGITASTMRNYLNGSTPPPLPAVLDIARAKGVTVGWLVGEVDDHRQGHTAIGSTGVQQAGGAISGSVSVGAATELSAQEQQLIDKLRQVGSPVMIDKIMKQLQDLENHILGS